MIIHIVPTIPNEASGLSYAVVRLCESLLDQGQALSLAVLDWDGSAQGPPFVRHFPLGLGPRRLGRSPAMARWIMEQARSGAVELIHSHGLWMMPNVYPGWARRLGSGPLVVSPHGTLSEWALGHHAFRKKIFWVLAQAQAVHRADCLHATAESEYQDIRRLGFRQPVCVLANGIDVPPLQRGEPNRCRTLLYLGRIHQIKGIDLLLRAWRAVQHRFGDWELSIAGPDDGGHLTRMQSLAAALGVERVRFPGPVYGAEKLAAYRAASLYVLPTHSENFGLTVAEALAAGTPVITTRGAPWQGLQTEGAGWWIEIGVDPLVAALEQALALPDDQLARMGAAGRAWMQRDFSWTSIAQRMGEVYRWLRTGGERPPCVRSD